jgi:hypothetical protein
MINNVENEELILAQHKLTKQMVKIRITKTNFDDENELRKIITEI